MDITALLLPKIGSRESLQEFIDSLREQVPDIERDIARLKLAPGDKSLLARLFRALHNVKGNASVCGVEIGVAVAQPIPTRPSLPAATPAASANSQLPIPNSPAPVTARTHTIAAGDTLAKISRQYYGTPDRWTDILAANRDILRDEKSLVIGRVIRIP